MNLATLRPVQPNLPKSSNCPGNAHGLYYPPTQQIGCKPWLQITGGNHQPSVNVDAHPWESDELIGGSGRWMSTAWSQPTPKAPCKPDVPWAHDPDKVDVVDDRNFWNNDDPTPVKAARALNYDGFGRQGHRDNWRRPIKTDMRLPVADVVEPNEFSYNNPNPPPSIDFPHSDFGFSRQARYGRDGAKAKPGFSAPRSVDHGHDEVPLDGPGQYLVRQASNRGYGDPHLAKGHEYGTKDATAVQPKSNPFIKETKSHGPYHGREAEILLLAGAVAVFAYNLQ